MPDRVETPALPHFGPLRGAVVRGWMVFAIATFVLYAFTANRGAQWQDSGDISLRIFERELSNPLGLALVHALHYWIGRIVVTFSGAEPVFAVTLVSVVAGAIAVANVYGCVVTAVRHVPGAVYAGVSLAFANVFWHLATITEVYTLTAALFSAECWCLLAFARAGGRWAFWGMLLFNGLGVANHLQAGLTTPVLMVVVIRALRSRRIKQGDLILGAILWLAGSLPYTGLVAMEAARSGDIVGTLRSALVGNYGTQALNMHLSLGLPGVSLAFLLFSFPNLLLPACVYGIAKRRQMGVPALAGRALLAGLVLHAVFVFRYNVVDQHTFLLPVFVLLCVFGGIGAAAAWQWNPSARRKATAGAILLLLVTPPVYRVTTSLLRRYDLLHGKLHNKPYRDDYEYLLVPWSVTETSADTMSRQAVRLAGDGGLIIVEDWMAQYAVRYRLLREGAARTGIRLWPAITKAFLNAAIAGEAADKAAAGLPVVLVPLDRDCPQVPPPTGRWARKGDLYVLDPAGVPAGLGSIPQ